MYLHCVLHGLIATIWANDSNRIRFFCFAMLEQNALFHYLLRRNSRMPPQQQQQQQQKKQNKRKKSKLKLDHMAIGKLVGEIGVAIAGESQRTVATVFNSLIALRGLSGHVVPAYMVATPQPQQPQQQHQQQQVATSTTGKSGKRKRKRRKRNVKPPPLSPPPRAQTSTCKRELKAKANIGSICNAIREAKKKDDLSGGKEPLAASHPLLVKLKEARAALAAIKQAGLSPRTKKTNAAPTHCAHENGRKEENAAAAARKRKNESTEHSSNNHSAAKRQSKSPLESVSGQADPPPLPLPPPPRPSRLSSKEVIYNPIKPQWYASILVLFFNTIYYEIWIDWSCFILLYFVFLFLSWKMRYYSLKLFRKKFFKRNILFCNFYAFLN